MSKDDSRADDGLQQILNRYEQGLAEAGIDASNVDYDMLADVRQRFKAENIAWRDTHTKREVAAARLDEAKIWNQMCHDRDIERITHDYYVKQRDDRIDRLETQLKAAQPDTGGGGDTR